MDDRQRQFVRMLSQAIDLLQQVRSAASLAPQKRLVDDVQELVNRAVFLRDDDEPWFYGKDSRGRMRSESGQIVEVNNE